MDYYRFGTCAGMDAPGGITLIGLMGKLSTPAGTAPEQLLLMEGHMNGGMSSALAMAPYEFLVHVVTGSVLVRVGEEEARLIDDNTVRIPSGTAYQFSTPDSVGMTSLVILPQQADPSQPYGSAPFPMGLVEGMLILGDPQPMALSSLGILRSLTRLTGDGCSVVMVQLARGNFHRDGIFASLLPRYAADPMALRAFIWACNSHPAAIWWLDRNRAERVILEVVAKLLAS